jgi:hypothetical protein
MDYYRGFNKMGFKMKLYKNKKIIACLNVNSLNNSNIDEIILDDKDLKKLCKMPPIKCQTILMNLMKQLSPLKDNSK